MSTRTTYCVCGQPYDARRFMIQCDSCRDWYHGSCVNVQEFIAAEMDRYHCPACAPTFGPPKCHQKYK